MALADTGKLNVLFSRHKRLENEVDDDDDDEADADEHVVRVILDMKRNL